MADSRSKRAARSPVSTLHRPQNSPGHLSKANSLAAPEDVMQAQVIYRKGSGLAALAKFMTNAQQLHTGRPEQHPSATTAGGTEPSALAAQQASATADVSRPSSAAKWTGATGVVMSHEVARHVRYNSKLKALHRTPHHMIISRVRTLLDQLHGEALQQSDGTPKLADDQDFVVPAWLSNAKPSGPPATPAKDPQAGPRLLRGSSFNRVDSAKPADPRSLVRKDSTMKSGSALSSTGELSVTDELSVILMFLNPFLAKLPDEARENLCRHMTIQAINRDCTIYKQGEEVSNFYLILSGIVESSSRRMGNRSKTLLKKGQCLGDRAILEGEPAAETCTAGSPVVALIVNRHDFLTILEPFMMEEKKGLVDFLRSAVGCFRDLPRGHIINLAQHMQQVDYPEGTEFDSSDTSVYFVKSGQVQLKAADKQLQDREVMQTVAQAAVAVQTMAATGPLSKVEIRDGQLIGTLGKQTSSRQSLGKCSCLLSLLGPGTFFGSGAHLNGEGDLQAALVSVAASPITLLVISIADFSKHATPELLRVMRDEVCFRLTYYQGRAGLVGVDAVVGHSSASLGPPDKALKKSKAKPSKRKAASQKAGTLGQQPGEPGTEGDLSTVEAIVQHYQAVQQRNAAVLQPSHAASRGRRADTGDKYYNNGTPAERYWGTLGSENNSKRQNVSSMLQTIFPDGLAPLAQKVAKVERKEQAKAARQAARQAAAAAAVSRMEADPAAADSTADFVTDHATGIGSRKSSSVAAAIATNSIRTLDAAPSHGADQQGASIRPGRQPQSLSFKTVCEAQARTSGLATGGITGGSAFADRRTISDAASAIFRTSSKPHEKHYSHGQKLAATMLWEAASGKSQPVRLRQCLTYSEIRMKNLAGTEMPLSRFDVHEPAFRVAQEV